MKTISPSLQSFLLANTTFSRADLITITLPNGTILRVLYGTNIDITYLGNTYYVSQFGAWERGPYKNKAEFKPSAESWELTAFIPESLTYPGTTTPLMQVLNQGMLSGAQVNVQTLFWPAESLPSAGFSMGTMQLTTGQIGNVKNAGRSKFVCEVYDLTYILNRPFPPNYIQSSCRHNLFDAGCTLLLTNFISNNVPLAAGSTTLYLNLNIPSNLLLHAYSKGDLIINGTVPYLCTVPGTSAGSPPVFNSTRGALTVNGGATFMSMNQAYPLGYILFTSGQNNGLKGSVKLQTISSGLVQLQLLKPLPFAIAVADNVKLIPGCDKTITTCQNDYNNLIHFGGMPFVPNPEIAQ